MAAIDLADLRLDWRHRHDAADVRRLVAAFPGRSMWLPETGEFALIAPWRNRTDIVHVAELSAVRHPSPILEHAGAAAGELGADMLIVVENDERRRAGFYRDNGFAMLEAVISMELDSGDGPATAAGRLRFAPVRLASDMLPAVEALDHRAFPWFWWNSRDEFASYLTMPDVSVMAGLLDGRIVSYFGVTSYGGWGHLDRIAVDPDAQGMGLGGETLEAAVTLLRGQGAGMIALSTQADNRRSRRLYGRAGFRRRADSDYRIYGRALGGQSIDRLLSLPAATAQHVLMDNAQ